MEMEDDDEIIMIIVGDEKGDNQSAMDIIDEPPKAIDESALDLQSVLERAEMHGEYISLINDEDYECEYLDSDLVNQECKPQLPQLNCEIKVEPMDMDYLVEDDDSNKSPKKGLSAARQLRKPKQSYIAQLRKNFPKMKKDEDILVRHLSEKMRNIKPPPPPNNFCEDIAGQLICTYCEALSLTLSEASRHYQKKHGSRYLICYACGADFKCTTGLYKHEKVCAAADARIVLKARGRYLGRKGRCRPFLTLNKFDPRNLNTTKYDKKRHFCSQCTASFTQKETLKAHEYMHSGYRPYQCDRCPVAYTSALALRRHITIRHTDIEYICDICERSFKAKTTLITHMDTHLPQRKFPCDRCERRFAQNSALRHHINRDHLKIPPPHPCAACPKRFPRMSNLKAHMKAKHGMTLMTRKMFFKALPTMKETELKLATIVFNNDENKVITAPLGELIFDKKGEPRRVYDEELPTEPDQGDSDEQIEFDLNSEKPSDVRIITEMIPNEHEKLKDILGMKKDVSLKENKNRNLSNDILSPILGMKKDVSLKENKNRNLSNDILSPPYNQKYTESKEKKISSEGNAKNKIEEPCAPYNQVLSQCEQEKNLDTHNDTVIRPSLEENYELEFVKFAGQTGIDEKPLQRDISIEINKIHKLIQVITSDLPKKTDVTADEKTESSKCN